MEYERLTKRNERVVFIKNIAGKERKEENVKGIPTSELYNRLAELEDLEEQGLIVKLPCKVGDDCYFVHKIEEHYELLYGYVKGISIDEGNIWIFGVYKLGLPYWHTSKDKDLFFFREEAEKKLKELKGE